MEQIVSVRRLLPDGMAEVIRVRESACSGDCHKCSGCGAAQQKVLLKARNPIGAQPGDMVVVTSETKTVLKAAAVLYMLPLVFFILGYLLGDIGALGLALSLGFASGAMLYVVFGEILPQAILMYHSKLPAFSAIAGILVGLFIIFA